MAVSLLCVLAMVGFATLVRPGRPAGAGAVAPPGPSPADGSRLFGRDCEGCHSVEEMVAGLRAGAGIHDNAQAMVRLLREHGESTEAEDWHVVAWLVSRAQDVER